jgi:hypothetical protein
MEPRSSIPPSQEPAIGSYPETDESCPQSLTLRLWEPFLYYSDIYVHVSQVIEEDEMGGAFNTNGGEEECI